MESINQWKYAATSKILILFISALFLAACSKPKNNDEPHISIRHYAVHKGMEDGGLIVLPELGKLKFKADPDGTSKCEKFINHVREHSRTEVDPWINAHYRYLREQKAEVPRKIVAVILVCQMNLGVDEKCMQASKNELLSQGIAAELANSYTRLAHTLGGCSNSEAVGQPILVDTHNIGIGAFVD